MGGWIAAEMAAMNPSAIDRLVLVAAAGLKPEQGEILDIFYYPMRELRTMRLSRPVAGPPSGRSCTASRRPPSRKTWRCATARCRRG